MVPSKPNLLSQQVNWAGPQSMNEVLLKGACVTTQIAASPQSPTSFWMRTSWRLLHGIFSADLPPLIYISQHHLQLGVAQDSLTAEISGEDPVPLFSLLLESVSDSIPVTSLVPYVQLMAVATGQVMVFQNGDGMIMLSLVGKTTV